MKIEEGTRIQLSSIKPDIKEICKKYKTMFFFPLENIGTFHENKFFC